MRKSRVTKYYAAIAKNNSPLWMQFTPTDAEDNVLDYEVSDPLNENKHKVNNRLIHRYKDRVLLLATGKCLLYCRHCFRRDFIEDDEGEITDSDIEDTVLYIQNHLEVHEILISGGDPFTLGLERLSYILNRLRSIRSSLVIRIGTRVPIVEPSLIIKEFGEALSQFAPIWIAVQSNHPKELTLDVKKALNNLSVPGINIVNQAVLLKGINDSVEIQKELNQKLLEFGVKPYYLFQGDLARGTSHFRVPISRGLEIIRQLRDEVSGLAMPIYAVDIPGGGGKIPLTKDYIKDEDEDYYYLENNQGFIGKYPKE